MGSQESGTAEPSTDGGSGECSAETATPVSRQVYETLLESVDGAVFVFDVEHDGADATFLFRRNNRVHAERTGITTAQWHGATPREMLGEGADTLLDRFRTCVRTGEEVRYRDRVEYPAGPVGWETTLRPVSDGDVVTHLVGIARETADGSDRERKRYDSLWQDLPVGLCRVDPAGDGQLVAANDALLDIAGADSREELFERSVADLWADENECGALLDGNREAVERRFQTLDGRTVWLRLTVMATCDADCVDIVVQDVTDRRQHEVHLEKAQEAGDIGWWRKDIPSDEIYWSERVFDMWGVDGEVGLLDHDVFMSYIYPGDRAAVEQAWEAAKSGEPYDIEHRIVTEDGEIRWMHEKAELTFDEAGDPVGAVGIVQDITDRKVHEHQLSALHGATREFIDADTKDEIAEIAADAATDLLDFSLPAMWYPTDDRSALVMVANSEEHQRLLDDAGTPQPTHSADSWFWDAFQAGETLVRSPIPPEDLAADVPLQSVIILPLGDHGVLTCAARGEVEFTDRQIRVAEILAQNVRVALDQLDQRTALERQKTFTEDLLDAIEDVVYVLDAEGNLQTWNTALEDVTGYGSDDLAAMNATDFIVDDDLSAARDAAEEAFETGCTRVELDVLTADGEAVPYEFIANVFEAPHGQRVMAGTGRDRSRHVEYETQLEAQRDNLEILNQVVRHDIRNDLQVALVYGESLAEHVDTDGDAFLTKVLEAIRHAVEITETARDVTDVMLQSDVERSPVRLRRVLETEVDDARASHGDAIVTVDGTIPSVTVLADDMLGSVFRNLLSNAIQHNDKEIPDVTVSATVDDDEAVVRVADNGPGIPDDRKTDIFERGEMGLDSEGTGLGLYLVETLVDRYDGDVTVEDNDPTGTVFVVRLPLADE